MSAESTFFFTGSLSEQGSDPLRRGKSTNEIDSTPKGQTPVRRGSDNKAVHEFRTHPTASSLHDASHPRVDRYGVADPFYCSADE
jgi:hypothetical protein